MDEPKTEDMQIAGHDSIRIYTIDVEKELLIPYYRGTGVKSGFPSPAMDYVVKSIDIATELVKNPSSTFFIEVSGDSMIDAFVSNPAHLIIDRSEELSNRDLVMAVVNREFTIKQYMKDSKTGNITLFPRNKAKKYPPIPITEDMDFEIWGVVTKIIIDPRVVGLYDRLS